MLLQTERINTFYGNLQALWDISAGVNEGEIIALIGSNGAGKTTFLKSITGTLPIKGGKIFYNNQDITLWPSNKTVRAGITLCPEGRQIFPLMTVKENLRMGGYTIKKPELNENYEKVYDLFPLLKEREKQAGGTLSGGEQQMLAIGRAIMGSPRLLMLDEPSLGLSPLLTEKIFELILRIKEQGLTIILVEQNAMMALTIADRGYVIKNGRIVQTGTGKEMLDSEEIVNSYLGV
ncbi:ABC transporter ATP-binding protein [Spirochaetia bacterium]|nr:ABC transporter ATP-binding protein [Spirochaetia bacterium]